MKNLWLAGVIALSPAFMHYALAVEQNETSVNDTGIGEQISDSQKSRQDSRQYSEVPLTAGYDKSGGKGFFIRSEDSQFRLNIGAYTQARYDINWREAPVGEDDVTKGFSFNRTKLFFQGEFTPLFNYHFRFSLDDEGNTDIMIAFLQYNISNKWNLRVGRQYFATTREDWMWGDDIMTTEFSAHDTTFALGAANGLQAIYQAGQQRFWFGLSDGSAAAQAAASEEQSDLALNGRWEYQLSGSDWSVWDDIIGRKGRSQGVLLGLGGAYQLEKDTSVLDRVAQLNADISFNGDGYQAILAASWTRHEPRAGDAYNNYGIFAQGGYFFTAHTQTYAQYNLISPGDQPGDLETFHSISAGVNYFPFIWANRWKFSTEIAHMFDTLNKTIVAPSTSLGWLESDEPGQTYLRLQAQFGF